MIAPSAPEQIVLQARTYKHYLRLEIKDASGAWVDYSDYVNLDMQDRAEVTIDVDARIAQATIELIRESGGNSLAPLLNTDIAVGRACRIHAARVAQGSTPVSADYKPVFEGEVDEWGHPETSGEADENRLTLIARDGMGVIADRWVEEETEYGSDDGTALEDIMQEILDEWADGIDLYVPTAPGIDAGRYRQERTPVLTALQTLADLIGWVIEWRWHSATAAWRLTLYEPDREPAATQWTFGPEDYFAVNALKVSRYDIRNVITVRYTDVATGARLSYTASSPTSISKYGRRWMELEEADDSPINSGALAQAMADPALLDLAEPTADQEITGPYFWPIQLGDFYEFEANGVHYDVAQEFGVVGYTHVFEEGEGLTRIRTRGKPVGSVRSWIDREHKGRPTAETLAGISLINFREISRTATAITYGWTLGSDLAEAWIHDYQEEQPYSDDKWPTPLRLPDEIVDDREATYTVTIPEAGKVGYLQVEGRRADGSVGQMERVLIFPANVAGDFIAFAEATVDQTDGSVRIEGWTTDRALSVAFAYNVGPAALTPPPDVEDAEAQGGAADGGGLVTGFTSDFAIDLPAGTVEPGEVIKGLLIAYIGDDGTGPDGTAQDHGIPVGFQGERFQITDPDQIADGVVISQKLREGAQNMINNLVWTRTDWDELSWSSGTIDLAGGDSYSILAGSTGSIPDDNPRYIYLDTDVSTTELQVATAEVDTIGDGRVLIAVAWRAVAASHEVNFVPVIGVLGIGRTEISDNAISTSKITANAITAAKIGAGEVTAAKIDVASLSAISADLGTVTAGTISAGIVVASTSFTAPNPVFTGSVHLEGSTGDDRLFLGASGGGLINLFGSNDALAGSLFAFTPGAVSLVADAELWLGGSEDVYLRGELMSFGAADSAGPGFRLVRVPN